MTRYLLSALLLLLACCPGSAQIVFKGQHKGVRVGGQGQYIAPLSITTSSLDDATQGQAYSQTLTATGGVQPYTWSVISGALPSGLSLSGSTGVISGIPLSAGTANFTLQVADSSGASSGTFVYVTSRKTDNLTIVDAASDTVVSAVSLGAGPYRAVITPNGRYVYSTNGGASNGTTVSITDTTTRQNVGTIAVGTYPLGIAITPDGNYIYVTNRTDRTVSVIATATNSVVATVSGLTTGAMEDCSDGTTVYVTNKATTGLVYLIRVSDNTLQGTTAVGNTPFGCAYNPQRKEVYVANGGAGTVPGTISVLDADPAHSSTYKTVIATISLSPNGYGPDEIAFTPDGAHAYVTMQSDGSGANTGLGLIDAATRTLTQVIAIGGSATNKTPNGVAVTPDGTKVYTTIFGDTSGSGNLISVVSTTSNSETQTITGSGYGLNSVVIGSALANRTDTQAVSLAVGVASAPVAVVTTSLSSGMQTQAYSQTLVATGGTPPYTWSLASGSLPSGLTLSSNGTIAGTPSAVGTSTFTVQVVDNAAGSATSGSLSIQIVAPPVGGDDFAARCAVAQLNSGRCVPLDTQLPVGNGNPVGTLFPDIAWVSSGDTNQGVSTNIVDTSVYKSGGGSYKVYSPGDGSGGGTLTGQMQANFNQTGATIIVPSTDRNGTAISGLHDFYVQWQERMDTARVVYNADQMPNSVRGIKQFIITNAAKYIDAGNWFTAKSHSDAETVLVSYGFSNIPYLYNGGSAYNNLWLSSANSQDNLIQNATGCTTGMAARTGGAPSVTSISRSSGVVTFTTSASLGTITPGVTTVYLSAISLPNYTVTTNTNLSGNYILQSNPSGNTYTATREYETSAPEDISQFTPAVGAAEKTSVNGGGTLAGRCWQYAPNQWMHFQLHMQLATDNVEYTTPQHQDSIFELWGGYEGQPSTLLISTNNFAGAGATIGDHGGACQNLRLNGGGTCSTDTFNAGDGDAYWWRNAPGGPYHSGYGQLNLMHYETDRCAMVPPVSVTNLSGSGTSTLSLTTSSTWNDGSGGQQCIVPGTVFVISGSTLSSGGFNHTYTTVSSSGTNITATCNGGCTLPSASGAPGGTNPLTVPAYDVQCNGSGSAGCNAHEWYDEIVFSTKRIPDPGHANGTNLYPDPPDHLVVTGSSGSVGMSWTCNDGNAATYKIKRYTGTTYQAEFAQNYLQIGTAAACASQYGTQTYTDSAVSAGTTYTYVVVANNSRGDSARSNPLTVTPTSGGGGGTNVVISNVAVGSITTTGATITWTTDLVATSQVEYGSNNTGATCGTTVYGTLQPASPSDSVTSHSIALTGLLPGTCYHYRVHSKGANNVDVVSSDGTFTTTVLSGLASASVNAGSPGLTVPSDFLGISVDFEYGLLAIGQGGTYNAAYRQLMHNLMLPGKGLTFNVESDGASDPNSWTATQVGGWGQLYTDLSAFGTVKMFMPANMKKQLTGSTATATGMVSSYISYMPAGSLTGIVMGNEPDNYGQSFAGYEAMYTQYQTAINALSGGSALKFIAPNYGGQINSTPAPPSPPEALKWISYLGPFITDKHSTLYAASTHYYAGNGCTGSPVSGWLLTEQAANNLIVAPNSIATYVNQAHASSPSIPFYVTEMNSIDCGGTSGVSNAFESALWLLDVSYRLAGLGMDGIRIFTNEAGDIYDWFQMGTGPYRLIAAHPGYFGALMFQQGTQNGAKLLPVTLTTSANLKAYATIDAGNVVRVTVINKDSATGTVTINLPGYGNGTLTQLVAPSFNSTSGMTIGGQGFDSTGNFSGTPVTSTIIPAAGSYSFSMGVTSAALLTVVPIGGSGNFPGLPTGIGWHALGSASYSGGAYKDTALLSSPPDNTAPVVAPSLGGSSQCPPDITNGPFTSRCDRVINAQSGGVADVYRNYFYLFGGGHGDGNDNSIFRYDLNTNPVVLRRATNPTVPANPLNNATCPDAIPWTGAACVPNSTTGLGCAPNAVHSTQGLVMIQDLPSHANDQFFKTNGSLACGGGGSTWDAWTIPMAGGINNSKVWTAYSAMTAGPTPSVNLPTGANFPMYDDFDPSTGLVYVLQHGTGNSGPLFAYDFFGKQGTSTPNKWYTVLGSWNNSSADANKLWHNAADTQRFYIQVPGCFQSHITNISRTAGSATTTLSVDVLQGGSGTPSSAGKIWVYNTGDSTLNVDALTSWTPAAGSPPTMTYTSGGTSQVNSGTGILLTCSSGGSGQESIRALDVTPGVTPTGSLQDWTNASFANANSDAGAGYNTCSEAFSGGRYIDATHGPLNGTSASWTNGVASGVSGGAAVGIARYTGATIANVNGTGRSILSGDLIIWPDQGPDIYDIQPDVANSRLKCQRFTFSGAIAGTDTPAATNMNGSANPATRTTWGTFNRFDYFPGPDVFFLVNAPDQPARILRIH